MNLREERSYQKLLETLDLMELTLENRQLAEQYLDMTKPENEKLLVKAAPQDFSGLDREKARNCIGYVDHLKKRGRSKELRRYVRFVTAVGGSTAYYVLVSYGWNLNTILEFLTREQTAAVKAEGVVWNIHALRRASESIGFKDQEVLREAMKLCYHKSDNAKVLLAALSLCYTKAGKVQGGFLKGLFSKEKPETQVQETVNFLEANLINSMPGLFTGACPSDEEMGKLKSFLQNSTIDADFPAELFFILQGKPVSEYLTALLSGAAFLAIMHSRQFAAFIRLTVAMDVENGRNTTLDTCLSIGGKQWFTEHIEALEESLPLSRENYVLWCLKSGADSPLRRAIRNHLDAVRQVVSKVSTEDYQKLLMKVQQDNLQLYKELNVSSSGQFRMKMAEELASRYAVGKMEAKQYLLGEAELDVLYPFVDDWRKIRWYFDNRKIYQLRSNSQEQQLYRRAVVLEGLCMRANYFNYMEGIYHKAGKEEIEKMLTIFGEEKVPARYQLEALGAVHDSLFQEKEKAAFINECVVALCRKKTEWGEEFVLQAKEGLVIVRFICIRVLDTYWWEYQDVLLSCVTDSSKQVRELLAAVYESHKEWEPEIKAMLSSKKSPEREMAVLVLKKWGSASYREELETALVSEKSKKIKELIESCLGMEKKEEGEGQAAEQTLDDLAKEILKGGKKRKIAWVYETPFPEVHRLDGTPAMEDYLAAVLVAYADMGMPGVNKDAARLTADLNQAELAAYMDVLLGKWLDSGAEAKKKWVLYAASIHGGETIIPALHTQIQEWPKAARGAMAAEAVKALALNGTSTALLLVDQISRKFKFRQVKTAAANALAYAAQQLGITKDELEDRIVPDLGFDERMELTYDYGTRSFKVALTSALELEVYDENGKKLKNLPAPGKKDDPEKAGDANDRFKQMKKQLKTVVTNQKLRLEQALSAERLWQVEKWKELFVKNPVMHQFAIGLIWGLYENGTLKDTFRYMEDGSFNTLDMESLSEEEYELPSDGAIGLVHPIELDEKSLAAWKEQLSDYEVVQPVEQLERPVYRIMEEEQDQKELTRFGGKLLNGLSLSGKLQSQGWYRGSVQDGGGYYTFYREDGEVGVELEFSGCYVGDENEEVTVYGAQFYKAGSVKRGSYVYDTIKKENQYTLSEVSPRYFSEIVLQLTKATASSQEQLPYPECKDN